MTEFTGERVIPGEVNDDLWAEHAARYAFAARYALDRRALDIGCGTGYGVAELAPCARNVTGIDIALEAVDYARAHFAASNAGFVQGSATSLPFADQSFDLATAFEVIEHLSDWRALLAETRRVLVADGVFLVSTPNKLYYAESRAKEGPNPFHIHEFEFAEFREALAEFFPQVTILLQNRVEAFAFSPIEGASPKLDSRIDWTQPSPAEAHFFLAVCGTNLTPQLDSFLYVPRTSNILREREQHIQLLSDELSQTKQWLATTMAERQKLIEIHEEQTRHLEEQNRWALQLEKDWKAGLERITQLQEEFQADQAAAAEVAASYAHKVAELEDENVRKTQWALETEARLSSELAAKCTELAEAVRLLDTAEATVVERTRWAEQVQARVNHLEAQFQMLRESRWLRLGRTLGLGPRVEG